MSEEFITKLDSEIDIVEVSNTLLKYKKFILICTAFFAVSSIFISFMLPVLYKSTAVLIESNPPKTNQVSSMANLVGIDLGNNGISKLDIALQVIKSRKFFVDFDNKRNITPLLLISDWDRETNTLTWPDGYEQETNSWINGSKPGQNYIYDQIFRKVLGVSKDPITNIVEISFVNASPKISKQIVEWLIIDLNEQLRSDDLEIAEKSFAYLSAELEKASSKEVHAIISSMMQSELQTKTIANSRKDYVFRVLDPPIAPELRHSPVRSIVCIVITIVGFIFAAVSSLIHNYFSSRSKAQSI